MHTSLSAFVYLTDAAGRVRWKVSQPSWWGEQARDIGGGGVVRWEIDELYYVLCARVSLFVNLYMRVRAWCV